MHMLQYLQSGVSEKEPQRSEPFVGAFDSPNLALLSSNNDLRSWALPLRTFLQLLISNVHRLGALAPAYLILLGLLSDILRLASLLLAAVILLIAIPVAVPATLAVLALARLFLLWLTASRRVEFDKNEWIRKGTFIRQLIESVLWCWLRDTDWTGRFR